MTAWARDSRVALFLRESICELRVGGAGTSAGSSVRSRAALGHEFGHAADFVDYLFDSVAAVFGGKDFGAGVVAGGGRNAHFPGRGFVRSNDTDLPIAGELLQKLNDRVAQGLFQFRISQFVQ